MQIQELFRQLAGATPRSLRPAAFKFTYVGPQKKPIPSVLVSTYHRLPALADFGPLQEPGLNYANDTTALLHFTVSDQSMARIAAALPAALPAAGAPVVALAAQLPADGATPARGAELLLPADAAEAAATALAAALDPGDGTGREVMAVFVQAAFGTAPVTATGGTP